MKEAAVEIFKHAVDAVRPHILIKKNVIRNGNRLSICDNNFDLDSIENLYIIGIGKGTAPMAAAIEEVLLDKITDGIIIVKYGHGTPLKKITSREAGHPLPDQNGIEATTELINLVSKATEKDLVICLISGGGSALLCDFPEGSNLAEITALSDLLLKSGANIQEMNAVRKHISKVKGGNLAKLIFPATLVSLILSDVIGDPLDVIASGPTVPDTSTFKDAMNVLQKYNIYEKVSPSIISLMEKGMQGKYPETPKKNDSIFGKTFNYIVGSNKIALEAAKEKAHEMGLNAKIVSAEMDGEAHELAADLVKNAKRIANENNLLPLCFLYGGETTVKIKGNGKGGRNQELSLAAAVYLKDTKKITILSGGTDGNDGPTNAAGAVVDGFSYDNAFQKGIKAEDYLTNNDSFHFFEKAGGHLITGPTLTNVMDLIVVIIE